MRRQKSLPETKGSSIVSLNRERHGFLLYCAPFLWCGIPWSRKTKHEVCLILRRASWGQEVSLLPSWRLWVLYNSVHKGPASLSPVINKWAAAKAALERGFPLSCHHTCFHIHRAGPASYEGWLLVCWTPGKAVELSCLVGLIIQRILTSSLLQTNKIRNTNTKIHFFFYFCFVIISFNC